MTSVTNVLNGRQLIIFNDYNPDSDAPPIQNKLEAPQIFLEYTPNIKPEADRLREELIQFKAGCESKPAIAFLDAMEKLISENEALETRNTRLTQLVMKHSEALFAEMASQLLVQIRRSPALERELNTLLGKEEHIALQQLVTQLNESIEDNWVVVTNDENHQLVSIEKNELKLLNDQICLLTTLGRETHRPQTVLLKSREFKEQLHPKKAGWGKKVLTGVLCSGWVLGQVSSFVLRMCLGITPSIIALLPSIFPAVWLELLKLLMQVLYKKMP